MKRIVSFILAVTMIIGALPVGEMVAWAEGEVEVTKVEIGKIYGKEQRFFINIYGKNLENKSIKVKKPSGEIIDIGRGAGSSIVTVNLKENVDIEAIIVDGFDEIEIGESQMPTIESTTKEVKIGDKPEDGILEIKGSNLDKIVVGENSNVKVVIPGETNFTIESPKNAEAKIKITAGKLGLKDIIFTKTSTDKDNKPNLVIKHTYEDEFRLISDLNIEGNLEMFPLRGEVGDKVYFRADSIPKGTSVFFLKAIDGTDEYSRKNMGGNPTDVSKDYDDKEIFTVEVPNIDKGEYYVVLTNPIGIGEEPKDAVTNKKVVEEKFTIIEGGNKATILTIDPNYGPDTGSDATITGENLGSLNVDDLTYKKIENLKQENNENEDELIINYELTDGKYKGEAIDKVEKRIKVIIGNKAKFKNGSTFSKDIDKLNIAVQGISYDNIKANNGVVDVIVETETILYNGENIEYKFKDRAVKEGGYRFIPSKISPEITAVNPERIQVVADESDYKLPEDRLIAIQGKNFMVYRMKDNEGKIITRYPVIKIGEDITLDKNKDEKIELIVIDNNGNIKDGSEGEENGSKILVYIPSDKKIPTSQIGKNNVKVINPIRNSKDEGLSATKVDAIEFVTADGNETPIIDKVFIDNKESKIVTTKGGEDVTITGSNFKEEVKVYIDGEEVKGIKRAGDGRTITFKAPPGRVGETQLAVINPSGGTATSKLFYVETHTDPKITGFAPKRGSTGTLVTVKGDNFSIPDPTASPTEVGSSKLNTAIHRLIGVKILLGGKDINEYNKDMELKEYTSPEDNLIIQEGERPDGGKYAKLSDYYHSVILEDTKSSSYYILDVNPMGIPILSDGKGNDYSIYLEGDKFIAKKKGGEDYALIVNDEKITLTDQTNEDNKITLTLKTVYKVDGDNNIVGNRVKVVDSNTIHFTVPILTKGDGWYDLAVENPDTKKDIRKGEQGFYYYSQPQSKPIIEDITPKEGSIDGGYIVDIIGKGFKDDGMEKSKVYIGDIEVDKKDIIVSTDGTSIKVKVPPYKEDLSSKNTDRITVPVVVVNPDGGSASKEDGFTYIVPTSHPEITRIIPQKESAAGGKIVEIFGRDFRYFEPFNDDNRNQIRDENELFRDLNGNGQYDDLRIIKDDKGKKYIDGIKGREEAIEYLKKHRDQRTTDEEAEEDLRKMLPKVYFGEKEAEVIEYDDGYLKVVTPQYTAGTVDVYLVNNDQGRSNKVKFTFESSNPKITNIIPNVGRKQGKDVIAIYGSGFVKHNNIKIIGASSEGIPEALVRFGDISNKNIPRDEINSGRIDNSKTTVELTGGLKVYYDASKKGNELKVEVNQKGKVYGGSFKFEDGVACLPLNQLKNGNENYDGYELVQFKLDKRERRLFVDRGYAPRVSFEDETHLIVHTPSYYTVGQVPVTLYNPDGGEASISFIYKNPDSNPTITNILRDKEEGYLVEDGRKIVRVNYKGVNTIDVLGSDFRKPVKIKIGDMPEITTGIEYDPDEAISKRMTFKMPPVDEKYINTYHRLVVENEDGGVAGSDEAKPNPIYIHIIKGETDGLAIDRVVPNFGPTAGGTLVTIEGKDFRAKMNDYPDGKLKVYFGDGKNQVRVKDEDIVSIEIDKIQVRTPAHAPGTVSIKVENPDENIVELPNAFTYISNPRINSVVDPENEKIVIDTISVEGGEKIKILGNDFMSGAKVVFNPVIKKVNGDKETGGEVITIGTEKYILESGTEGTEVEVKNSQEIIVTTPPGKIDTTGVMVINPDKGATPIYNIKYGIPEIGAPQNVTAEVAYDQYIKVNWKGVTGATEYEIYVSEDDEQFEYIGSTELLSFVYQKIRSRTKYQFMVRAIGKYGSSKPLDVSKSNTVRTGSRVGPEDDDGKLSEDTIMERVGNTANVIVGYRDFDKDLTIDLTRGNLAGSDEVVVSIPADIVAKDRDNNIIIIGKDYTIKFRPGVFKNTIMKDNRNRDDAGVRFKVAPYKENIELKNNGMTVLANRYMLEGHTFVGNSLTTLDYLNGNMEISLDYDEQKSNMRRMKRVFMARYDSHNGRWEEVSQGFIGVGYMKFIDRLGLYTIIGSRR